MLCSPSRAGHYAKSQFFLFYLYFQANGNTIEAELVVEDDQDKEELVDIFAVVAAAAAVAAAPADERAVPSKRP